MLDNDNQVCYIGVMTTTNKKAPDDSSQWKCPWVQCTHGSDFAGSLICPAKGEWDNPNCTEFVVEEQYRRKNEARLKIYK